MLVHRRVTSLFFFGGFLQRILSEHVEIVCKSSNIVSGSLFWNYLDTVGYYRDLFFPFYGGHYKKRTAPAKKEFMASQPTPGPSQTHSFQIRPYDQLFLVQWFPIIRPAMKPVFLRGVGWPAISTKTTSNLDQPGWFTRRNRFITLWRNFLEVGSIRRLKRKKTKGLIPKRRTKWAPPGNDHIFPSQRYFWVNDHSYVRDVKVMGVAMGHNVWTAKFLGLAQESSYSWICWGWICIFPFLYR